MDREERTGTPIIHHPGLSQVQSVQIRFPNRNGGEGRKPGFSGTLHDLWHED